MGAAQGDRGSKHCKRIVIGKQRYAVSRLLGCLVVFNDSVTPRDQADTLLYLLSTKVRSFLEPMMQDLCGPFFSPYEKWVNSILFIDFSPVAVRPGAKTTPCLSSRFLGHVWNLPASLQDCNRLWGHVCRTVFGYFLLADEQPKTMQFNAATRVWAKIREANEKLYHG